jgi:N,N'-diacetyllegionaminate synthase
MNIGGIEIGAHQPTYVIAEIGSNHGGSFDRAVQLIQSAADAGADAAKFQLFRADELYPGQRTQGSVEDAWLPELKDVCHEAGVEFLCSVFSRETLDAYLAVEPAAVKIASPEATDADLIAAAAATGLPLLVSTGAMTWQQTDLLAAQVAQAESAVLLHCVSAYPAPRHELNLAVISEMRHRYAYPVGFSDHTLSVEGVPVVAVAAGACVIEKHFTYSRLAIGADHSFALEPAEFAGMVAAIRDVEVGLGDGVKRPAASEDATDRRKAA